MQTVKRRSRSTACPSRVGESVCVANREFSRKLIIALASLARIIVYSMAPDALPSPGSNDPTPFFTPQASGTSTPLPQQNGGLGDYLSSPLGKGGHLKAKTHLAGCKALDSLAKLIASTESFFHPTNSGSWTSDVRPFLHTLLAHLVFSVRHVNHSISSSAPSSSTSSTISTSVSFPWTVQSPFCW